jgi:hypothetical protein
VSSHGLVADGYKGRRKSAEMIMSCLIVTSTLGRWRVIGRHSSN